MTLQVHFAELREVVKAEKEYDQRTTARTLELTAEATIKYE
jgi:hypothetical protein